MEAKAESLETSEVEENICGECGCLLLDEEPSVRIESVGKSSLGMNLVNVTFETTAGFIDILRGIIEASGRYTDMGDYITRTLHGQADAEIERLAKPGRVRKLMEEWGKGTDPEEHGIEFAS